MPILRSRVIPATCSVIVNWMVSHAAEHGPKHIPSKSVRQLPEFSRHSTNANLTRARRLRSAREQHRNREGARSTRGQTTTITRATGNGAKRVGLKARPGRGRKREARVLASTLIFFLNLTVSASCASSLTKLHCLIMRLKCYVPVTTAHTR